MYKTEFLANLFIFWFYKNMLMQLKFLKIAAFINGVSFPYKSSNFQTCKIKSNINTLFKP